MQDNAIKNPAVTDLQKYVKLKESQNLEPKSMRYHAHRKNQHNKYSHILKQTPNILKPGKLLNVNYYVCEKITETWKTRPKCKL